MSRIRELVPYSDARGNVIEIVGTGSVWAPSVDISFRGTNNRLVVDAGARLSRLAGFFDGDNGVLEIGSSLSSGAGAWGFRVGEQSRIVIGAGVSCTRTCAVTAVEGTELVIGDDCMFAAECIIRTDDAHAIYDVRTGDRVNPSRNVIVGDHVWLALGVSVLPGATIGSGTVVGTRSVVTGSLPNNCVAAGVPARVLRTDTAWERPHLSIEQPPFRPNASVIQKTVEYWNLTREE